jgi:hypothetical protein
MIPLYDLGPIGSPKIIGNKQIFPMNGIIDISGKCPSAMQILYHPMIYSSLTSFHCQWSF